MLYYMQYAAAGVESNMRLGDITHLSKPAEFDNANRVIF